MHIKTCADCQAGKHDFGGATRHTRCVCPHITTAGKWCACMAPNPDTETTKEWTLRPGWLEPETKCVCDIRMGCTCAVGKAELEKERAGRRERDRTRLHYV